MLTSHQTRHQQSLASAAAANAGGFSDIYRAYSPRVSCWVRRLGGPHADAEDLMQEVFTVVLRRLGDFDPERGEIGGWLYGITIKVVQGARRKRSLRVWLDRFLGSADDRQVASHGASAEDQVIADEAKYRLYSMLDELPETHRTVFILFELEELDGATIAAVTNTSVANVWVRLHRARRALQEAAEHTKKAERT